MLESDSPAVERILPLVLVTEPLAPEAEAWLAERCSVARLAPGDPDFASVLARAEGLIVRTYTQVDAALLATAPRLRVVGRAGVGLDNIDQAACAARGIAVLNTPDANTQAVVEYVFALIFDALRPRAALAGAVDGVEWNRLRREIVGTRQLDECTFGIVGCGRIGRRVIAVAEAIGMRVLVSDLRPLAAAEHRSAAVVPVEQLFHESDVISIHIDGRPENRGALDDRLIASMRSDVVLLNTSRGFVLDHVALATFLRANPAALALLDVHDPEPITATHPLLGLDNAHLFPHLASRTETALRNMSWVVRDVVRALTRGTKRGW